MDSARYYYEEFHQLNLPRLGPYIDPRNLTKLQEKQVQSLHQTYWIKICQEIGVSQLNYDKGEIAVPSPWHAWALLKTLHLKFLEVDNSSWNTLNNFTVPAYRGHENADYKLIPSLFRRDTNHNLEKKYLNAFTFIFTQKFLWQKLNINPTEDSAKTAAQHYGIKTDLLDITADPAIAVYFASSANNKKQDEIAAVLVFDLEHLLDSNVKLILPPPIVERLYIQRGAFLQLIENGKQKNILLSDNWFQKVVDWSKKWAALGKPLPSTQIEINDLLITVFENIGYPNFTQCDPNLFLDHWIDQFEEMIYWYAIRINGNSEGLLSGVCENIAKNNPELVQLAINNNALANGNQMKIRLRDIWTKALNANHL